MLRENFAKGMVRAQILHNQCKLQSGSHYKKPRNTTKSKVQSFGPRCRIAVEICRRIYLGWLRNRRHGGLELGNWNGCWLVLRWGEFGKYGRLDSTWLVLHRIYWIRYLTRVRYLRRWGMAVGSRLKGPVYVRGHWSRLSVRPNHRIILSRTWK